MSFKSVFIGIDKYQSPLVTDLSCSARDARALHGLFGDTFGTGDSILLTDAAATKSAILAALGSLKAAKSDDVVVIGFSGHGSDSHHLVCFDADPFALDASSIHLDELTEIFSQIPAQNVILLLDCCFAGGAGAKVFSAPIATKAAPSAEAILRKISGKGRLIFTAATATQEAIEDRRKGHGFFTHFLIEALRGAPEIVKAGEIPVMVLLDFVTKSVISAAKQINHHQDPTVRGLIEGDFTFPVLMPGDLYKSYFPEQAVAPITSAVSDLAHHGFPQELLEIWSNSIPCLNEIQLEAINKLGLFDAQHLVVSAPTSSGKTMIGELAMLARALKGERSYMLLPLRALVNDKYTEFSEKYHQFGVRVIRSTGEIADDNDALLRGKFDVALLTYERFAALAVTMPHILRQVSVIVIDEVQMITDMNRGANLEFVLTLLKAQRLFAIEPQVIALSAVIGDTNKFETWLNARLLRSDKRPVPLEEGLLTMDGSFRFFDAEGKEKTAKRYVVPEPRKGSSQDVIIPLVRQLVKAGEKVIVFRETKQICRATANYLAENLGLQPATDALANLPDADPSAATEQLRKCLGAGVAFHNSDLDRAERQAVEVSFRDSKSQLKVLVATTTLAMGVNTPAWSVVIAGLSHPDAPYSIAEYKNMVGRAGRLGFSPKGKSFLVAASSAEAHHLWNKYVMGKPEGLESRFGNQEALSLICRVLATASNSRTNGLTQQDLVTFIQSTFAAHQKGEVLSEVEIVNGLKRLQNAGLVEPIEGRYRLTELGKVAGELGIQVNSVVRISQALKGLPSAKINERTLLATTQVSIELDEVLFPVHKKSIKEQQRWRTAALQQNLPRNVLAALHSTDDATYTTRCKRFCSVLMWLEGVELNRLEESLLQHLPGDNAAGPIRATAERSRDLIGVVARIAALVSSDGLPPPVDVDALSGRLELGIPNDMYWLAKETKRGLDRGDYLALRSARLISPDVAASQSDETLLKILKANLKVRLVREAIERIQATKQGPEKELPMPTPAETA